MLITIIEKEISSIQSSVYALKNAGYEVEVFNCINQALNETHGDMILLSTLYTHNEIEKFVTRFHDKTILLLVNHKTNESLTIPLNLGAKDYVMKPINSEFLIKKIQHFEAFASLQKKHDSYKNYHEYILKEVNVEEYIDRLSIPLIIVTNNIAFIDQLILAYANLKKVNMVYVPLGTQNWRDKIKKSSESDTLYLSGLETLGIKHQNILFELIKHRKFIISSFISVSRPYRTVEIVTKEMSLRADDILNITDYAIMIIKSLQYKYPDVKIAERLGCSRKKVASLRKRFNLVKE